jgi:ketosteroid isomerase-like protein
MSTANVQIVRCYFEAIIRGVESYWEGPRSFADALTAGDLELNGRQVLDHLHQDVRWKNVLGLVFEGKLDCTRAVDELIEASQYYSVGLDEVTDLGGDQVLAVKEIGMRGENSSATAALNVFSVLTVRGGLITSADE